MAATTICIDASFVIRFFGSHSPDLIYQKHWVQWKTAGCVVVAPTLLLYKVCNAFHRAVVVGQITQEESEQLLERACNLGLQFYRDEDLHRQALKIAQRENLAATYDAHYLALSERLGIEFWTCDRRLFNAVQPRLPWVRLMP